MYELNEFNVDIINFKIAVRGMFQGIFTFGKSQDASQVAHWRKTIYL